MKNMIKKILFLIKYKNKKISIGKKSIISLNNVFEGNNKIGDKTLFEGNIGYGSYIGNNSHVVGNIGRFCSIADNVNFITGFHPLGKNITTSPLFYSNNNQTPESFAQNTIFNEFSGKIIVSNNVWIGYGATILGCVNIGEGAVIGAKALVTKDVKPYSVVGGVPAKVIKMRFDEVVIKKIIESNLWDKSIDWYKENYKLLLDYEVLFDEIEGKVK